MKNPLNKRFIREFKEDFGKYFVILALLIGTIGFVSGFLVADGSMIIAYNESFTKYNIEDGHFTTKNKMNKAQKKAIEQLDIQIYDNSFFSLQMNNGSTLRTFKNREDINKVCLMEGEMPAKVNEIAIDRMYADNNNLSVGDVLSNNNTDYKITGLVALSDYSCLFESNSDTMFDSIKFGVAIITEQTFETLDQDLLTYCYSWKYNNPPANEKEESEISEELMKNIAQEIALDEFVPQYINQAIQFTGEDMGGDKAMMIVLLYILITILAFVFGVTTSNTISKEANVIGTLRASGYTRNELIHHYMTMPIIVTCVGAIIGNILGYTFMKDLCASMYYGSYSLPTYVTIFNAEAFLLTTIVPIVLMFTINYLILRQKMKLSPLKFIRRDLKKKQQKHVLPLSYKLSFFTRFRLRIIFQNMSNYIIIFIGILFANLLLFFGMAFPSLLNDYQTNIEDNLICNYQYMLAVPSEIISSDSKLDQIISMLQFSNAVETDNEEAEKFSAYALNTTYEEYNDEEITIYGIEENSQYVPLDVSNHQIYVTQAYHEKYLVDIGDSITLKEKYDDDEYTFTVNDIYNYQGGLCIFMNKDDLNKMFDLGNSYFSGYFSNTEITDIDDKYMGTTIDLDALTKVSRQLTVSMGNMMYLVQGIAIIIFMIIIYLLSKIIIEKNAQSISMTKILGYNNGEVSRLYILSTSIVVLLSVIITIPLVVIAFKVIYRPMMIEMMAGWLPFLIDKIIYLKMFVLGMGTYIIIALLEYKKIKKVPMDEALKNVE